MEACSLPSASLSPGIGMYITWQFGSDAPENANNFSAIAEWWKSLQAQDVLLKQRLIPEEGELDWSPQKFDEQMTLVEADVRGISFYWRKADSIDSSNITPAKVEFAPALQRVYLYPENRENLVISFEVPQPQYATLAIDNPDWFSERQCDSTGNVTGYRLVIRDHISLTDVTIQLDEEHMKAAKQAICES